MNLSSFTIDMIDTMIKYRFLTLKSIPFHQKCINIDTEIGPSKYPLSVAEQHNIHSERGNP